MEYHLIPLEKKKWKFLMEILRTVGSLLSAGGTMYVIWHLHHMH